jgi:phenylalanyl-tRNA synthetase beta chain
VKRILGMDFDLDEIERILVSLECICTRQTDSGGPSLRVDVPSYRLDVSIPADLIEDIARIHGYEAIPLTLMHDVLPPQRSQPVLTGLERTRDILVGCGLTEVITYALTSLDSLQKMQVDGSPVCPEAYIRVANPISQEREFLRQSLLPSMLETLRTNSRYRQRMLLFEIGRVYLPQPGEELPWEPRHLAVALTGAVTPASWHQSQDVPQVGFTHLKGVLDTLCQRLHIPGLSYTPGSHPALHPARTAVLTLAGTSLGIAGELHPQVGERFDLLAQPVALLELDFDQLLAHQQPRQYQQIPRFPAVLEDLALIVDADVPVQAIQDVICAAGGQLLRQVELFDLYQGPPIPPGQKSVAYALTFQAADRSLTEDEVRAIYQRIQQRAAAELGAQPRR